jgi:hypothetical protein
VAENEPKTVADTRSRMNQAVRDFRNGAAQVGPAARARLADRARRAIERLRKQFQHKIDDQLRRDAKRHWGIGEGQRLGLERQLRLAAEGALARLDEAVRGSAPQTAEPGTQTDPRPPRRDQAR